MRKSCLAILYTLIIQAFVCFPQSVRAGEFQGKVIDAESGSPITDVNVYIPFERVGTVTDQDGYFKLSGEFPDTTVIRFEHVGYFVVEITYAELVKSSIIKMKVRPVPIGEIKVVGKREKHKEDLPGDVLILNKAFIEETQYSTVGKILNSESAISVESTGPGEQTVSVRGSNPDQVLVLLDGIPLNSTYTDKADISWIEVSDLSEIQMIKSSQSSVFGSGAVGGVLNLKSKRSSEELLNMIYRYGDHSTRDGYISIGKDFSDISFKYSASIKSRKYGDSYTGDGVFRISSDYNRLFSSIRFSNKSYMDIQGLILNREIESADQFERTIIKRGNYSALGNINFPVIGILSLDFLYRDFSGKNRYYNPGGAFSGQPRNIYLKYYDQSYGFRFNKKIEKNIFSMNLGMEYSKNLFAGTEREKFIKSSGVDEIRTSNDLGRDLLGMFAIIKHHAQTGSKLFPMVDFDLSIRRDQAITRREYHEEYGLYPDSISGENSFQGFGYRLGVEAKGEKDAKTIRLYFINGRNIRLPSLNDVFLNDLTEIVNYKGQDIAPEKVISYETGGDLTLLPKSDLTGWDKIRWQLELFKNMYVDKLYRKPIPFNPPVTLNASLSSIGGLESSVSATILKNKIELSLGSMWIRISREDLFPNKPQTKYQLGIKGNWEDFRVFFRLFYESEQYGMAFLPGGVIKSGILNKRKDADLIVGYRRKFNKKLGVNLTFSMSNIFSKDNVSSFVSYFDRSRTADLSIGVSFF